MRLHPKYPRDCGSCAKRTAAGDPTWNAAVMCNPVCYWDTFDPWAHRMFSLWTRVQVVLGQSEAKATIYDYNGPRLREYIESGHDLVEGEAYADLIDAMLVCVESFNP